MTLPGSATFSRKSFEERSARRSVPTLATGSAPIIVVPAEAPRRIASEVILCP